MVPLGVAVFDQSFQDLRRRQSATPEVEIIIYRNHLGFASSSTGNGSVRFGGEVLAWVGGADVAFRLAVHDPEPLALPLLLRDRHSLPESRQVAVVRFSVPGRSPAHLDSSRT